MFYLGQLTISFLKKLLKFQILIICLTLEALKLFDHIGALLEVLKDLRLSFLHLCLVLLIVAYLLFELLFNLLISLNLISQLKHLSLVIEQVFVFLDEVLLDLLQAFLQFFHLNLRNGGLSLARASPRHHLLLSILHTLTKFC